MNPNPDTNKADTCPTCGFKGDTPDDMQEHYLNEGRGHTLAQPEPVMAEVEQQVDEIMDMIDDVKDPGVVTGWTTDFDGMKQAIQALIATQKAEAYEQGRRAEWELHHKEAPDAEIDTILESLLAAHDQGLDFADDHDTLQALIRRQPAQQVVSVLEGLRETITTKSDYDELSGLREGSVAVLDAVDAAIAKAKEEM